MLPTLVGASCGRDTMTRRVSFPGLASSSAGSCPPFFLLVIPNSRNFTLTTDFSQTTASTLLTFDQTRNTRRLNSPSLLTPSIDQNQCLTLSTQCSYSKLHHNIEILGACNRGSFSTATTMLETWQLRQMHLIKRYPKHTRCRAGLVADIRRKLLPIPIRLRYQKVGRD